MTEPESMWTTKDGNKIPVTEMSDQHLKNAINMLINKFDDELASAWGAAASFDGESMASYYAESEANAVAPSPWLPVLQAEAARRGLRT